jgi:azurin
MVVEEVYLWTNSDGVSENDKVVAYTVTDGAEKTDFISPEDTRIVSKSVVIDGFGNSVAVWQYRTTINNRVIQVSTKSLNGNWTQYKTISSIGCSNPVISINSLGYAVVVWEYDDGTLILKVQASIKTPDGNWSTPTTISDNYCFAPDVKIDNLGNIVAVWVYAEIINFVQTATKTIDGNWTDPQTISDESSLIPKVAVDNLGNAIAVWETGTTTKVVQAATKGIDGKWSTPKTISSPSKSVTNPQIVMNSLGNAIVAWFNNNSGGVFYGEIYAATKSLNGNWTAPKNVSGTSGTTSPRLAMDSLGNAVLVWIGIDDSGAINVVYAADKSLNSDWSKKKQVSLIYGLPRLVEIAIDSLGNAIAVWNVDTKGYVIVQSSSKSLDGEWTTPKTLTPLDGRNEEPVLAIYNSFMPTTTTSTTTTTEPICLVAGTPITTDQGVIAIEKIDVNKHTIGNKRIVAITKAITPEKQLVVFERNSVAINCPLQRTIMTPGHEILYKGQLVQAKHFVGRLDGVHTIPYNGKDVLYNVLQEQHGLMKVNNMVLETLHPSNKVARQILEKL